MLRKIYMPEGGDENDRIVILGLTHEEIDKLKEPDQLIELADESAGLRIAVYCEETDAELDTTFLKLIGDKGSNE